MPTNIAPLTHSGALNQVAKFHHLMDKLEGGPQDSSWPLFEQLLPSITKRHNLKDFLDLGCPRLNTEGVIDTTPSNHDLVRLILGDDFITPKEVVAARGLVYNDEQLVRLEERFPSIELIAWCRGNDYMLLPAPPEALSLLAIRDLNRSHFYSKEDGWYAENKQQFSHEDLTAVACWLAIRKGVVPNSTSEKWKGQTPLLSEVELGNTRTQNMHSFIEVVYLLKNWYIKFIHRYEALFKYISTHHFTRESFYCVETIQ